MFEKYTEKALKEPLAVGNMVSMIVVNISNAQSKALWV